MTQNAPSEGLTVRDRAGIMLLNLGDDGTAYFIRCITCSRLTGTPHVLRVPLHRSREIAEVMERHCVDVHDGGAEVYARTPHLEPLVRQRWRPGVREL